MPRPPTQLPPQATHLPSREAMLAWVRHVDPASRFRHTTVERDGVEVDVSGCRMTVAGEPVELYAEGVDAEDKIVELAYREVRARLGRPLTSPLAYGRDLERQIIAARFAGQHAHADALEAELISVRTGSAAQPRERRFEQDSMVNRRDPPTRAPFGQRPIW